MRCEMAFHEEEACVVGFVTLVCDYSGGDITRCENEAEPGRSLCRSCSDAVARFQELTVVAEDMA